MISTIGSVTFAIVNTETLVIIWATEADPPSLYFYHYGIAIIVFPPIL